MKKVLQFSICMLAVLTSIATTYAKDNKVKVDDKNKKEITLTLDDVKQGQQLLIKDINGLTLYKEDFKNTGSYSNTFNLSNLPNGSYYFEHEKDYQVKIIPFEIQSGAAAYNTANFVTLFKPVTRFKNNTVYISKLALNKEDLHIKIYYKKNSNTTHTDFELLHSETISNQVNIERIYSLSEKQQGEYKIVFETEGRFYTEYMHI
ncbi:hypothetical protein [Formosa sp. A9]|uniref:hypothetical protein n=1 Tax=Formosa sp. A9 TaxID=3442641 RepID=UPI003EB754D2